MSNFGISNYITKITADGISVSSSATEEKSSSYLIPANVVIAGDILEMFCRTDRTVNGGATYTVKIYSNTSDTLIGAQLLATYTTAVTTAFSIDLGRIFVVKSSTVTQGLNNSQSNNLRYFASPTTAFTETNIDWTVDQYIIVSLTNNGAGQTVLSKGMLILKY